MKLTKKQTEFLDLSIMITYNKDLYVQSDQINGKTFAIFSHSKGNVPISDFGTFREIVFFIHGNRTSFKILCSPYEKKSKPPNKPI